jgi:hypothetical protein
MYKYQVNFEKTFTVGALKGRHYSLGYIRFCDWKSADEFAKSCDGKTEVDPCDGTDWRYVKSAPILTAISGTILV